ncbi:MAG: alpha/beta fold hydrolase [Gemmatimonadales bacterium]
MTAPPAQESARRVQIEVRGGAVPVWLAGDGPPVVLLHGLSANHTEWLPVAAHLRDRYTLILPDLLGRGDSKPEPWARFTLADETDRIAVILDALGVRDPVVAGHSNGAALAVSLASHTPCTRVVLFSPVTPWTKRPGGLDVLQWKAARAAVHPLAGICRRPLTRYILTRRVYGDHPPPIEDAVRRYSNPYANRARARALLRILTDWRPAELADLEGPEGLPLHIAIGERDRRIAPEHARAWARHLGAEFTLVAGAGHGLTEERPEVCAQLVANTKAGA